MSDKRASLVLSTGDKVNGGWTMKHKMGESDRLKDLLAPYHGAQPQRSASQMAPEQPTAGNREKSDDTQAA